MLFRSPNSARVREQVNRTHSADDLAELLRGYLRSLTEQGLEQLAPERIEWAEEEMGASG